MRVNDLCMKKSEDLQSTLYHISMVRIGNSTRSTVGNNFHTKKIEYAQSTCNRKINGHDNIDMRLTEQKCSCRKENHGNI